MDCVQNIIIVNVIQDIQINIVIITHAIIFHLILVQVVMIWEFVQALTIVHASQIIPMFSPMDIHVIAKMNFMDHFVVHIHVMELMQIVH
jgi:hypothetical protein